MKNPDILVSQVMEAPLETVWESWADFGGIYKFHDDVLRTTILTASLASGIGAARLCELADGKNEIEERIIDWQPMERMGMEFIRTSLPIAKMYAEFHFEELHGQRTLVTMQSAFEPRGLVLRLMKVVMKRRMQAGFEQLLRSNKQFVESL